MFSSHSWLHFLLCGYEENPAYRRVNRSEAIKLRHPAYLLERRFHQTGQLFCILWAQPNCIIRVRLGALFFGAPQLRRSRIAGLEIAKRLRKMIKRRNGMPRQLLLPEQHREDRLDRLLLIKREILYHRPYRPLSLVTSKEMRRRYCALSSCISLRSFGHIEKVGKLTLVCHVYLVLVCSRSPRRWPAQVFDTFSR